MNIQTAKYSVSMLLGLISSHIINLLGGGSVTLTALVVFMVIDFMMGLALAVFWGKSQKSENGKLSSKACWRGIIKKVSTFLIIIVANQADLMLSTDYIRNSVIIAFCISELISICENAGEMGILPKAVQKLFNKVIDVLEEQSNIGDDEDKE